MDEIVFNEASPLVIVTSPRFKTVVVFAPLGQIPSASVTEFNILFCKSLVSILLTPRPLLFAPIGITPTKDPFVAVFK